MTAQSDWTALLLRWFDANRRDLPWREARPRNPYHVWVSEIMLQQTRTETVKDYFRRWMDQFPTLEALARAPEEQVLRAWQGLGYYSRARNLHKAARQVMVDYGGEMPRDARTLESLPGIGAYTAGAIASMAFGQKVPAVDGNLLRVLARLYGVDQDIASTAGKKTLTGLAEAAIPADRPGDFNEALMDLGANVCIPKVPRCAQCPLRDTCQAFQENRTDQLPVKRPKAPQKEFAAACGLVVREGKFLLHKRPGKGMLASMWEFPMVLGKAETEARQGLETLLQTRAGECLWEHKHVFTHQIWYMKAYILEGGTVPEGEYGFFSPEEWEQIPLAGPHAKLAAFLKKGVDSKERV
ncbi:A/G-specific adenine glycosylase [Acidaminococcus timonensis]|uniref:A/G-specific adenine glycosylase n=1 Tax=Acidaminococcus timonensis TaxID=1871002 RepID=UPI0026E9FF7E|nr:A/G-specific adenine glycosylase [Acidaminococcus timonensis]